MSTETNYFAAVEAHIESITPAHRAAFQTSAPTQYEPGDLVWVIDHYNTGRIVSPSVEGSWCVELTDADGQVMRLVYDLTDLRLAAQPVAFRWPAEA